MADSNFRGPVNSMGSLEIDSGNTATIFPQDGPSLSYQGHAVPDIRSAPFAKDGFRPGQQAAALQSMVVWACDNVPMARTTTAIATTQVATAALAMSLQTVGLSGVASACSIAVGVPIIPVGTSVATHVIALDFGFTTGSTVANSSTVHTIDNTFFQVGQWVIVGNVGNSALTRSLITQVQSLNSNGTGITIAPVAAATLTSVPIGQANLFGSDQVPPATQFGPAAASANAHSFAGMMKAGLAKVINPRETLARTINIATDTTVAFTAVVTGYDVWGNLMTEMITVAATTGATSVVGTKAFKYILSVVPGTGNGTNLVSVGLGESFGFPYRVDEWDQTETTWANSRSTNSNGFNVRDLTSPATNTTDDVRGTVQVSTAVAAGALATAISAVATNGTSRLSMKQTLGVWNQIAATPLNTIPMFGIAQSTA